MDTEKEFFEEFDEASWEFTYGHLDNMDYNVLQVGLTAVLYINEGWRPEKREAMANAIERYVDEFGDKLKWGFLGDVNSRESFYFSDKELRKKRLMHLEDDAAETQWNSGLGIEYVSDYQIKLFSPAGWFEHIHGPVTESEELRRFGGYSGAEYEPGVHCKEKLTLSSAGDSLWTDRNACH